VRVIRVGTVRQGDQLTPNVQLWARSARQWVGHSDTIQKQPAFDPQAEMHRQVPRNCKRLLLPVMALNVSAGTANFQQLLDAFRKAHTRPT
jgi:DNA polymerase IIIc chi subunit